MATTVIVGGYDSGVRIAAPPGLMGPNSGVYSGSLSAQGNMVATQLNPGGFKVNVGIDTTTGESITIFEPFHAGYLRTYWEDPTLTTFGSDSAIPAITGVVPSIDANGKPVFSDMQGSLVYYIDIEMTRLTGNNSVNLPYMINSFNQAVGWVSTSNDFLAALKNAENHTLEYYRSTDYKELVTQGLAKYQTGNALLAALKNIGKTAETVIDGNFGTPNAVAKTMLMNGLGFIGNLSTQLTTAKVNLEDIGNVMYTDVISSILQTITNPKDLESIQDVLESSIPNMRSPIDYCYIDAASGMSNDSVFANLAEVGKDLFTKAPNLVFATGNDLAIMIENVQSDVSANVEALATSSSILSDSIIDQLRDYLPIADGNKPVSVLNVVGMASGYLTDQMNQVNEGLARLYATSYGPQIRAVLENISSSAAKLPITQAQIQAENDNVNYWDPLLQSYVNQYYQLLRTIVSDTTGEIPAIVKQINDNYFYVASQAYNEFVNYNRARIEVNGYGDVNTILAFVSSLPGYGEDFENIGTDLLLYGMCQPTQSGETVKAVLGQSKNNSIFNQAGVQITGIL